MDDEPDVGMRLRALRTAKGLSARRLADLADVTPAYLSRLETGQLSPTVGTLARLMKALDEPVAALFAPAGSAGPLVRRDERSTIQHHGVSDQLLSPLRSGRLEVLETVVAPGAGSGDPYSHGGDEECVVVLSGTLRLDVGPDEYVLSEGDALTFACRTPHAWMNTGRKTARALWVITPASY